MNKLVAVLVVSISTACSEVKIKHVYVKPIYTYEEHKDWVNDSTVSINRRYVYDYLIKQ